jgi:hypothetical protein
MKTYIINNNDSYRFIQFYSKANYKKKKIKKITNCIYLDTMLTKLT